MRRTQDRLRDVADAIDAARSHLARGGLDDPVVFDAVRMRFVEIGEAVKAIDPALLASEPGIPWREIAGARDHVAHRYFDTARAVLQATIYEELPPRADTVRRLLAAFPAAADGGPDG